MPTDATDTTRERLPRTRPIWFPVRGQPCAGWLYEVAGAAAQGAVVLCPSIGLEYEASHRAFRVLAPRLAGRGFAVLRFDYLGCGDSSDDPAGETGPAGWAETIHAATALLRTNGFGRISLVGVRLGALLAAGAAASGPPPVALAYWYPSKSGKEFLRLQAGLRRMIAPPPDRPPDEVELTGVVLGGDVAGAIRGLPPLGAVPPPAPTLILTEVRPPAELAGLAEVTAVANPDGAERLLGVEQQNSTPDPKDIERIVEHVVAACPGTDAGITTGIESASSRELATSWGTTIRESPVRFCSDRLFGVLTEPADEDCGDDPTASRRRAARSYDSVVFLNAVDLSHIGPGREWVQQARRWASLGIRSLRLDIGGVGDSSWPITDAEETDYPATATEDILCAIRYLSTRPSDRTLLVGLCSGAFRATAIAGMGGIAGVCLLNPTRFATPPRDGGVHRAVAPPPAGPSGGRLHRWRSSLNLRSLRGHQFTRTVAPHVPDVVWHAVNSLAGTDPPVRELRELVARGVAVHIISGPDDAVPMRRGAERRLRRLATSERFSFDVVASLDHNFHAGSGRDEAMALAASYVRGDKSS